jgi:glycosyltransferase involved in cell wall biosynthesis
MYNRADATINCASNEGFGLSSAESIMCGTMVINNVTGGLQDQVGFKRNGKYLTADDYLEIQSMHDRDLWKDNPEITWGDWALPIWPSNRSIQGSPMTPYIFDDRADYKEIAQTMKKSYDMGRDERKRRGKIGHDWAMSQAAFSSKAMGQGLIDQMGKALDNFEPQKRFNLYKIG